MSGLSVRQRLLLADACLRVLTAQRRLAEAVRRKEIVLEMIHEDGVTQRALGGLARRALASEGFGREEIARLGLSDGNVRLILARAKNAPGLNPSSPFSSQQ